MIPFGLFVGILLLKQNVYGFLLSPISLVLFINMAISIMSAEVILGLMTNTISTRLLGLALFAFFLLIDFIVLFKIVRNFKRR